MENSPSKLRILVTGGMGFIGSHLARELRRQGHIVTVADWQSNKYWKPEQVCDKFIHADLRVMENCIKATKDQDWVFHLAANMGGMGFIQSNNGRILYDNVILSFNVAEAARISGVKRFFYSSSACIYPEHKQEDVSNPGLKESDAWPAAPQDAYGLEKILTEELIQHYEKDFGMITRCARFHNIYGPNGTWKGGREKFPAVVIRKAICSNEETQFEVWGDGKATRSYTFIDDCVEGILRIMKSDYPKPLNLGSDEMISVNDFARMGMRIAKNDLPLRHVEGPQGVRGRNSDNQLIRKTIGWAPGITLEDGMTRLYNWMKPVIDEEVKSGVDVTKYAISTVVKNSAPIALGTTKVTNDE